MVARARSTTLLGIDAHPVEVEAQIIAHLRRFSIVGLPDGALREAKERVRCAIESTGIAFPHHEVVVSLAPAALPKSGSGFDLAIALCILAAQGDLPPEALRRKIILGELALDGRVKPTAGALPAALYARRFKDALLLLHPRDARIAALVSGVQIIAVESLGETLAYLRGLKEIQPFHFEPSTKPAIAPKNFADVVGQHAAKRALEIGAAGGHNLLMIGPPGSGKSMLAQRIVSLLPPLSSEDRIDVMKVQSAVHDDVSASSISWQRPFRSPHHTISVAGLVGGGTGPAPGEISLAHRGVLFLDELSEFRRDVLESLRQPMEDRVILLSRATARIRFPADFVLLAAMNPCPCGRRGSVRPCECSLSALRRHFARISGPILDRFDMQIWVPPVAFHEFRENDSEDPTKEMQQRVLQAREKQQRRFMDSAKLNVHMGTNEIRRFVNLGAQERFVVERAAEKFQLSARGYNRVLKVARTIADLDGAEEVTTVHVNEALSYRLQENEMQRGR